MADNKKKQKAAYLDRSEELNILQRAESTKIWTHFKGLFSALKQGSKVVPSKWSLTVADAAIVFVIVTQPAQF